MKTKYETFFSESEICEWIDKHPEAEIIAITAEGYVCFTIFYQE